MDGSIRCCFDQTAVWHSDAARGPSTPSFDHLVGARQECLRDRKAECLGGLEIDDQLDLHLLLDRQIGWLFTLENATGVKSDLSVLLYQARSVNEPHPSHYKLTP